MNTHSDNDLPQLDVHVEPVAKISTAHLQALLKQFRAGETQPLILGESTTPEAAVIPFKDFLRLVQHDTERTEDIERDFEHQVGSRIEASDASGDPGTSWDEVAATLGKGRSHGE